jgi:hypothetical protein
LSRLGEVVAVVEMVKLLFLLEEVVVAVVMQLQP